VSQTPPFEPGSPGDWILGEQLALPRQAPAPEEAEAFLQWLFSAVARRPKRLELRKGAGVARYLRGLAWETPPGPLRRQVERMAEVIWRTMLACAPFDAAGQGEVLQFLDQHAETYLVSFDVAAVREWVRRSAPPAANSCSASPPDLMSFRLSASGVRKPQLADDLSERIYAAYHGLRRAGIRGARRRIAAALNAAGRRIASRTLTDSQWEPYEVYERVKQYERGLRERFGNREIARSWGESMVSKWVFLFRSHAAEEPTAK
jgi:hypothetical protein